MEELIVPVAVTKLPDKSYFVNFVTVISAQRTTQEMRQNFFSVADSLPPDTICNIHDPEPAQIPMTTHAVFDGGMTGVELDDNICYAKGQPTKSNTQLIQRTAPIAHEIPQPDADLGLEIDSMTLLC